MEKNGKWRVFSSFDHRAFYQNNYDVENIIRKRLHHADCKQPDAISMCCMGVIYSISFDHFVLTLS